MKKRIKLTRDIFASIEAKPTPIEGLLALYAAVYGDEWDRVEKLKGFPSCNQATARRLMDSLSATQSATEVGTGMLWVNNGFSGNDSLPDNEVELCGYTERH